MYSTRRPTDCARRLVKTTAGLGALLLLFAGAAAAQMDEDDGFSFSRYLDGYLRMRNYLPSESRLDPEHIYEWRVKYPLPAREWLALVVSADARIDYSQDEVENEERRLELYEAYGDVEWGGIKARVGQQVIRWGKGDEVNPLDNFTPEDFSEAINLDRAERKMPVAALYPRIALGDRLSWEGVFIPQFRESRIADPGSRWEPYIVRQYRSLGFTILPDDPPDEPVWATRVIYMGDVGDVSLMCASHREEIPAYRMRPNPLFVPDGRTSPGSVEPVWEPVQSVGADFEVARDEWGYRGECVFTTKRPYVNYDRLDFDAVAEKDTVTALLGLDHIFADDYYMNLQVVQEYIFDYEDQMQPNEYDVSLTYRFWKQLFRQKLRLQLTGRHYLTKTDHFWKLGAVYELAESVSVDAGYIAFAGEEDGLFGQFADNDQVFINLKYSY